MLHSLFRGVMFESSLGLAPILSAAACSIVTVTMITEDKSNSEVLMHKASSKWTGLHRPRSFPDVSSSS